MRRRHQKSRLGCLACKRRKIKCDESKPQCNNCVRFGIKCDFSPLLQVAKEGNPTQPIPRRGRPRSDWASWEEQIRRSTRPPVQESQVGNFDINDIEIYHNYITKAAVTLLEKDETDEAARLWLEGAPKLGFQQPCILNLILAFSAYHMARFRPYDAAKFKYIAEKHCNTALQQATQLLQRLEPSTSPALYITSVLVCFTALAQGPREGHMFLVASNGQVPWLSLIRGVKLVVKTTGWSSIFTGPLAAYKPRPHPGSIAEKDRDESSPEIEDWRLSLRNVSDVVDLFADDEARKEHQRDLKVLESCFQRTFGTGEDARPDTVGKIQVVMMWVYTLEDSLVDGLHRKDAIPLILLGHFCVLLHTLRGFWFLQGWGQQVMNEILRVSEASRKWLAWPLRFLENCRDDADDEEASSQEGGSTPKSAS